MIVVTNNPLLKEEEGVLFVEGGFRDVLLKVRDMVFSGYELVTHPLFASSRMQFSPFRTVLIGKKRDRISEEECRIAEDSLITYDKMTAHRNRQPEHDGDYAILDKSLYLSSLDEIRHLTSSHIV